jgi:hypothetical protein
MDDYDFTREMTDEQIRLAKAAGKLVRKQASGSSLYDSLTVGEALLVGRAAAMKAARVNHPNGKQYAQAFAAWKKQFGFTLDNKGLPLPTQYLDNCILAAANRTVADRIIAELSPGQRAGMGISGLAARVRREVSPPSESRMTPARQTMDQLNTLTDLAGINKSAAEVLRRHGLAVVDADLVVIDEKRFATWLDVRQRRLLAPPA